MRENAKNTRVISVRPGHFARLGHLFAAVLLACSLLALPGCFGIPDDPAVAAYVNGEKILEDDVTAYIEGFRAKNSEYETDVGWADFLLSNGYTSERIRTYVLNSNFIPKALIRQQCEMRDIMITGAELDRVIEQEKAYYEQRYGENTWDSVLASYGYDEDTWRENELDRLLEEQLMNTVITDATPTEEEIQAVANASASNFNGKSSYYIAFDSEQAATDARNSLNMTDDTTSLEAFQGIGNAVFAGWNSLSTDRDEMSAEYVKELNSLELNHVSQPVQQGQSWLLIYCNATFNVSPNTTNVELAAIPAEIYAQLVHDATTKKTETLFSTWLTNLTKESEVVIEPMPEGLPYSVNVTLSEE